MHDASRPEVSQQRAAAGLNEFEERLKFKEAKAQADVKTYELLVHRWRFHASSWPCTSQGALGAGTAREGTTSGYCVSSLMLKSIEQYEELEVDDEKTRHRRRT